MPVHTYRNGGGSVNGSPIVDPYRLRRLESSFSRVANFLWKLKNDGLISRFVPLVICATIANLESQAAVQQVEKKPPRLRTDGAIGSPSKSRQLQPQPTMHPVMVPLLIACDCHLAAISMMRAMTGMPVQVW